MIGERAEVGGAVPPPVSSRPAGWLSWAGLVAAGFTTLCCIGVSAALSLATAMGATFLTRDSGLRPLLAASLAVTVVGSALTSWPHRRPGPLALTAGAAIWVYAFVYLVGGSHRQTGPGDQLGDHAPDAAQAGLSTGRLAAVWLGLAVLVITQVWDVIRARRTARCRPDRRR